MLNQNTAREADESVPEMHSSPDIREAGADTPDATAESAAPSAEPARTETPDAGMPAAEAAPAHDSQSDEPERASDEAPRAEPSDGDAARIAAELSAVTFVAPQDAAARAPAAVAEPADEPQVIFADLGLSEPILRAIEEKGYKHPTPIQAQAIPAVLSGRDVMGVAQTGTGKTASFTLPMLDILSGSRSRARMPRSLILEPTRELALQVAENFVEYGKYLKLNHALLIGGESLNDQKEALMKGVDVLIATPGRLIDLFERGGLMLTDAKLLVIDEADRMLDMGFIPDVERIVAMLPKTRQTLFFSATMAPEIRRLSDAFLSNPRLITVIQIRLRGHHDRGRPGAGRRERQARGAAPADPLRGGLQRADLLQPQARRRHPVQVADPPRLLRRLAAWRHEPAGPLRHAGQVQEERAAPARLQRRGRARHRHRRPQPRVQFRRAAARGRLRASHRPHRPRRARSAMPSLWPRPTTSLAVDAIEKLTGYAIPRIAVPGLDIVDWAEGDSRKRRGRAAPARGKSISDGKADSEAAPKAPRAPRAEAEPGAEPAKPRRARGRRSSADRAAPAEAAVQIAPEQPGLPDLVEASAPAAQPARPEQPARQEQRPRGGRQERGELARSEPRSGQRSQSRQEPRPDTRPDTRAEQRPEPRQESRAEPRQESRFDPRADRDRGRYRRDDDLGPAVLGFGDDVPAFMTLPRRPALAALPDAAPETATHAAAEA